MGVIIQLNTGLVRTMSLSSYTTYFQESRDSQFQNFLECKELVDIEILVGKLFWEAFNLYVFTGFQK